MKHVFAENAWLGPGNTVKRALFTFDDRVQKLETLHERATPPGDAIQAKWLLPGFINAHCHLEYACLKDKLPRGSVPFGQWLRAIMESRFSDPEPAERLLAMEQGARALLAGGCTTVVDSSTDGASRRVLENHGVRHYIFHEVLGLTQERAEPVWNRALTQIHTAELLNYGLGNGLNPHSPYSVGRWLRQQLITGRNAESPALSGYVWHLAETDDEDELFLTGEGSIGAFLKQFKLPMPFDEVPGKTAAQFLASENLIETADIVFHGNTLTDEEAAALKAPRALVHCPSTHRWFGRKPAPLAKRLRSGVNVCLGTDSLASSDTLSMFTIVQMTMEDHPELSADEVLVMACLNPAKISFLMPHDLSLCSILEGKKPAADFITLNCMADSEELTSVLKSPVTRVSQVWVQGTPRL